MTIHTYLLSDQEVADLVAAIVDALDCWSYLDHSSDRKQEQRWEALLKVLQDDKTHA